ncbi:MAG TPA: glycosyltransferase family 87 protein [Sphingomicrobium sp.]|nr:glycosyltransferase family 87 protein [Sphingomicrobium sp.]
MTPGDDRLVLLARVAPWFALAYAALWSVSLDLAPAIPRDGTGLVVGRDFLNLWMAGKAAWGSNPAQFYDLATYQQSMVPFIGADYPGQIWSYPPSVMLIAAPFGLLPYLPALILWTMIGPLVFVAALRGWTNDRRLIVAALLCPAAIFGLISGQFFYLGAALILTVLRWRHARPVASGALLGLLTIKPQLGLFFPLLLIAERNWRGIGSAALVAGMLILLSSLLWGPETWQAYFTNGAATQARVLSDPERLGAPFMPTIFMNLRTIGVPVGVAYAVQGAAAIAAALLVLWGFAKPRFAPATGAAFFLAAALFGTPYLLNYDTLAFATAMLLAAPAGFAGRWLTFGAWFLTLLQLAAGNAEVPGPALIAIMAAAYLVKQAASSTCVDQRNWPTGCTQSSE